MEDCRTPSLVWSRFFYFSTIFPHLAMSAFTCIYLQHRKNKQPNASFEFFSILLTFDRLKKITLILLLSYWNSAQNFAMFVLTCVPPKWSHKRLRRGFVPRLSLFSKKVSYSTLDAMFTFQHAAWARKTVHVHFALASKGLALEGFTTFYGLLFKNKE